MSEKSPKAPSRRAKVERKEKERRFEYAYRSVPSESHPTRNEDAGIISKKLHLVGVFDGVGGHAAGREASRAAAATVLREIQQWEEMDDDEVDGIAPSALGDVLQAADKRVISRGNELKLALPDDKRKMWQPPLTTGTIAKLHEFKDGRVTLYLAHVGDSRAYVRHADGTVEQLTKDDDILSTSDELDIIEATFGRRLTEDDIIRYREMVDEAAGEDAISDTIGKHLFRMRSHVRKTLGTGNIAGVQTRAVTVESGDMVFITSDGVHDNLTPKRIKDIAATAESADELTELLTHEAYEYGHLTPVPFDAAKPMPRNKRDDMTVVAVKVL